VTAQKRWSQVRAHPSLSALCHELVDNGSPARSHLGCCCSAAGGSASAAAACPGGVGGDCAVADGPATSAAGCPAASGCLPDVGCSPAAGCPQTKRRTLMQVHVPRGRDGGGGSPSSSRVTRLRPVLGLRRLRGGRGAPPLFASEHPSAAASETLPAPEAAGVLPPSGLCCSPAAAPGIAGSAAAPGPAFGDVPADAPVASPAPGCSSCWKVPRRACSTADEVHAWGRTS